jgi:hypothetical protein
MTNLVAAILLFVGVLALTRLAYLQGRRAERRRWQRRGHALWEKERR